MLFGLEIELELDPIDIVVDDDVVRLLEGEGMVRVVVVDQIVLFLVYAFVLEGHLASLVVHLSLFNQTQFLQESLLIVLIFPIQLIFCPGRHKFAF